MKKHVAIIILHFGPWDLTKACLDSLSKTHTKNINLYILLIDNSNNKNAQNHPVLSQIITPSNNLGFAALDKSLTCLKSGFGQTVLVYFYL